MPQLEQHSFFGGNRVSKARLYAIPYESTYNPTLGGI